MIQSSLRSLSGQIQLLGNTGRGLEKCSAVAMGTSLPDAEALLCWWIFLEQEP